MTLSDIVFFLTKYVYTTLYTICFLHILKSALSHGCGWFMVVVVVRGRDRPSSVHVQSRGDCRWDLV